MSNKVTPEKVLNEIKQKDIKMHSKHYYVMLTLLTVLSAILLTTLSAILARLWLNDVDYIGKGDLLRFGPAGRGALAASFPWGLTILTVLSIYVTIKLFKKLEISYKHGLWIFYSGISVALILMVITVSTLDAHKPFERFPGFDRLQTLRQKVESDYLVGTVIEIDGSSLMVEVSEEKDIEVDIEELRLREDLEIGERVRFLGEYDDADKFEAKALFKPRHRVNGEVKHIFLK